MQFIPVWIAFVRNYSDQLQEIPDWLHTLLSHSHILCVPTHTQTHSQTPLKHSRVNVNSFCGGINRFNPALLQFWTTAVICRIYDITFSAVNQVSSSNPAPPSHLISRYRSCQKTSCDQWNLISCQKRGTQMEILLKYRVRICCFYIILNWKSEHLHCFSVTC